MYKGKINKIQTPFGSIDIAEDHENEHNQYQIGSKYRFRITDMNGGDITKSKYRDIRIDDVLGQKSNVNVLYNLYLTKPDKWDSTVVWINLNKNILKIGGDDINVKFKCESLQEAEKIIDMILEPNELEVAPVNKIK